MFKCYDCGEIFEESELAELKYHLADYGNTPVYDTIYVCPHCGRDNYYEVRQCEECGEWCATDSDIDVSNHIGDTVCEACLNATSVDIAYQIGAIEGKQSVQLNSFLAFAFTPGDIEAILMETLRKNAGTSVEEYVRSDASWFEEQLAKVKT